MKVKSIFMAALCACAVALTACGGAPKSTEVKDPTCVVMDSLIQDTITVDSLTLDSITVHEKQM